MPVLPEELQMTVHFDGDQVSASPDPVVVTEETAVITLTLESSVSGAAFPSSPIEWINENHQAIPDPENFDVIRDSSTTCTITDHNHATSNTSHQFFVIVEFGNQIFRTDPTIINQPPGGTGGAVR